MALAGARPRLFLSACIAYFTAAVLLIIARRLPLAEPAHRRARERRASMRGHRAHPVRQRGVSQRLGHPAGAAGGRMALLADHRDAFLIAAIAALAVLVQQISSASSAYAPPTDYTTAGVLGCGAVRHRPVGVAGRQPPARERGAGAAPGGRPRQPRAALAVHRAAPAREHPGRGSAGSDPPDQRIGRPACSATTRPTRTRCWARPRRGCCICWRPGARTQATRGIFPRADQTFVAADGARIIRAHFAPLGNADARAGAGLPGGHEPARREGPAIEARGPGPPERQHRPRDPQSGRRHEPRRPAAGRVASGWRRRTAPDRDHPHERRARQRHHRQRAAGSRGARRRTWSAFAAELDARSSTKSSARPCSGRRSGCRSASAPRSSIEVRADPASCARSCGICARMPAQASAAPQRRSRPGASRYDTAG